MTEIKSPCPDGITHYLPQYSALHNKSGRMTKVASTLILFSKDLLR